MDQDDVFLNTNVSDLRFVAWDTETTGITPGVNCILELAAIAFDEDFEQRRFSQLIKNRVPISPEVTRIHGITEAMVKDSPEGAAVYHDFYEFLKFVGKPRVLLAHNAGFDVGMLHGEPAARMLGAVEAEMVLDTCMLAKTLLPELPMHSLEMLARHFKVQATQAHRALEDVKTLHQVFMQLLGIAADKHAQRGGGLTLSKLIDLCGGYFILQPGDAGVRSKAFRLPPRLHALEQSLGSEQQFSIVYGEEEDARYITPINIRMKGFRVYVEAFCHRDQIKKTFRADKILKIVG